MTLMNKKWTLRSRPETTVSEQHFHFETEAVRDIADGEFLVKNHYLSFEPAQRGWLNDVRSYVPPVAIGEVMRAMAVGEIVASKNSEYQIGDRVQGGFGWQKYAISDGTGLFPVSKIPAGMPISYPLHIYGLTGLSAYFGLLDIGKPKAGDTVVVSGAAGATGSTVGQLAKLMGCRVIGIAGGQTKCQWLMDELGYDAVIDYKAESVDERLSALCKNSIDVFFDNVGGDILDAALVNIANHARIVLCGGIASGYQGKALPPGPKNYMQLVIRRSHMEGFIVLDHVDRYPQAIEQLQQWVEEEKIRVKEHILEGIEQCPTALAGLFSGQNFGKQLVKI
ncbi:MAG: NADPH-dependent curcumin reductase CurA [Oceanicoccus sp.]|jgi:NADPH-dependent curcumin reductase CurA